MAEDTIIVIDRIEEAEDKNGKTYLKITDKAGVTRNFKEGRAKLLTNKGHLLEEGKAIKLHFEDYKAPSGQVFPFVRDFEAVASGEEVAKLPAQPKPEVPLQEGEEDTRPAPAPQAVGMMTKEIGDMIRAKMLTTLFGATIKKALVGWYRSQVFGITRITYDGKDLPE